jgi:Ammonium Transporter Family
MVGAMQHSCAHASLQRPLLARSLATRSGLKCTQSSGHLHAAPVRRASALQATGRDSNPRISPVSEAGTAEAQQWRKPLLAAVTVAITLVCSVPEAQAAQVRQRQPLWSTWLTAPASIAKRFVDTSIRRCTCELQAPSHLAATATPPPARCHVQAAAAAVAPEWAALGCTLASLLVVPGLALFQLGLLRAGSVNTLLLNHVFVAAAVPLFWALAGFSLVASTAGMVEGHLGVRGLYGALDRSMIYGTFPSAADSLPQLLSALRSMVPAIVAPCIVAAAAAERVKPAAMLLLSALWLPAVYVPVAHAAGAGPGGLLSDLRLLDGGGSLALSTATGMSALMVALLAGKRAAGPGRAHNLPTTVLGTALLAVGWIAYIAGGATTAAAAASSALAAVVFASLRAADPAPDPFVLWLTHLCAVSVACSNKPEGHLCYQIQTHSTGRATLGSDELHRRCALQHLR